MVDRLQPEHLALPQYLLLAEPEIVAVLSPPWDSAVVRLWILRVQHERRHELDQGRLRAFGPRVIRWIRFEIITTETDVEQDDLRQVTGEHFFFRLNVSWLRG